MDKEVEWKNCHAFGLTLIESCSLCIEQQLGDKLMKNLLTQFKMFKAVISMLL